MGNCTDGLDAYHGLFSDEVLDPPTSVGAGALLFVPLYALLGVGIVHLLVQPTAIPWLRPRATHTRQLGVLVALGGGAPLGMLVYRATDATTRCALTSVGAAHIAVRYGAPAGAGLVVLLHAFVALHPTVARAALLALVDMGATAALGAADVVLRGADGCATCASTLPAAQWFAAALGMWTLVVFPRAAYGGGGGTMGGALRNWLSRHGQPVLQTRPVRRPGYLQGEI